MCFAGFSEFTIPPVVKGLAAWGLADGNSADLKCGRPLAFEMMTIKIVLTVWSIRLALLLFSLAVIGRLLRLGRLATQGGWKTIRAIWVTACLLAVLHVVAVFGYVMNWSHQAAIEDTARRTQQMIGVTFGGGVYFNYMFLLVWTCDAMWWCGWPDRYLRRSQLWDALVIGYLWFIAFNAAVVFESGAIRWLGLLATLVMATVGMGATVARKRIR